MIDPLIGQDNPSETRERTDISSQYNKNDRKNGCMKVTLNKFWMWYGRYWTGCITGTESPNGNVTCDIDILGFIGFILAIVIVFGFLCGLAASAIGILLSFIGM